MESDRRALFREYIRQFNPIINPLIALKNGLYVASPLGTASRIGHRLDIEPSSSHLLIGGIGSGKTTELLRAKNIIDAVPDMKTIWLDVPSLQSISALREGVLVALAFRGLVDEIKLTNKEFLSSISPEIKEGNKLAIGYWDSPDQLYEPDDEMVHVPGVLTPPENNANVERLVRILANIVAKLGQQFIVFFDGLDRVRQINEFAKMVLRDVELLRRIGVGTVVVGPQEISFDQHKYIVERFTAFHLHGATDVHDTDGLAFLDDVLTKRSSGHLFPRSTRFKLARFSGGLLRDLISLARDAGEIAYSTNSDIIDDKHVEHAADRFGRSLLLGITPTMIKKLLNLKVTLEKKDSFGSIVEFIAATEQDISLLLNRLVIEIPSTPIHYYIHPCVRMHLNALRRSANA